MRLAEQGRSDSSVWANTKTGVKKNKANSEDWQVMSFGIFSLLFIIYALNILK
jgi:hypothetical protein